MDYADDIAIETSGKYGGTVSEVKQSALSFVENWCNIKELSIDHENTTIAPFTKKNNLNGLRLLGKTQGKISGSHCE